MYFILGTLIVNQFVAKLLNNSVPGGQVDLNDLSSLPIQETRMDNGASVLAGHPPYIMNWLHDGQLYNVDVYLSTMPKAQFFGHGTQKSRNKRQKRPPIETAEPVWSLRDLVYSLNHKETNA